MFDISWSELMLIGVVALVVIGPKELPGVLRTLGQMMRKVRSMAADFQGQFQEAMREAEMADLKKEVDNLAHDFTSFDPLKEVRSDVENMGQELNRDLDRSLDDKSGAPATDTAQTAGPAPAQETAGETTAPALPEPGPVAAPAAEFPLPEAAAELAGTDAAAAGTAPVAPAPVPAAAPAKPETGGRAA